MCILKNRKKIFLIVFLSLVLILAGAFVIYVSDYYRADDLAMAVMQNDPDLLVRDNLIILSPETPVDTALIFYPGGKVEFKAYLPILEKIKEKLRYRLHSCQNAVQSGCLRCKRCRRNH